MQKADLHSNIVDVVPSIVVGIGKNGRSIVKRAETLLSKQDPERLSVTRFVTITGASEPVENFNDKLQNGEFILEIPKDAGRHRVLQAFDRSVVYFRRLIEESVNRVSLVKTIDDLRRKGYNLLTEETSLIVVGALEDVLTQSLFLRVPAIFFDTITGGLLSKSFGFLSVYSFENYSDVSGSRDLQKSSIQNKYLFLKEINHFMDSKSYSIQIESLQIRHKGRPYNFLFLIDNVNKSNQILAKTEDEFNKVQGSLIFNTLLSLHSINSRVLRIGKKYGKRIAAFSSAGLSSYLSPFNELKEIYSYKLTQDLVGVVLSEVEENNSESIEEFSAKNIESSLKRIFDRNNIESKLRRLPLMRLKKEIKIKPSDVNGMERVISSIESELKKRKEKYFDLVHKYLGSSLSLYSSKLLSVRKKIENLIRTLGVTKDKLIEKEDTLQKNAENYIKNNARILKIIDNFTKIMPDDNVLLMEVVSAVFLWIASLLAIIKYSSAGVLESLGYVIFITILTLLWLGSMYYLKNRIEVNVKDFIIGNAISPKLRWYVDKKINEMLETSVTDVEKRLREEKNRIDDLIDTFDKIREETGKKQESLEKFLDEELGSPVDKIIYPFGEKYRYYNEEIKNKEEEWRRFAGDYNLNYYKLVNFDYEKLLRLFIDYGNKRFSRLENLCKITEILASNKSAEPGEVSDIEKLIDKSKIWAIYSDTSPGAKIDVEKHTFLFTDNKFSRIVNDFNNFPVTNKHIILTRDPYSVSCMINEHGLPLFAFNVVKDIVDNKLPDESLEDKYVFENEDDFEDILPIAISQEEINIRENFLLGLCAGVVKKNEKGLYFMSKRGKRVELGEGKWETAVFLLKSSKSLSQELQRLTESSVDKYSQKEIEAKLKEVLEQNKDQITKVMQNVVNLLIHSLEE